MKFIPSGQIFPSSTPQVRQKDTLEKVPFLSCFIFKHERTFQASFGGFASLLWWRVLWYSTDPGYRCYAFCCPGWTWLRYDYLQGWWVHFSGAGDPQATGGLSSVPENCCHIKKQSKIMKLKNVFSCL